MAKNRPLVASTSSVAVRKGEKKRKHPPLATVPPATKVDGPRMQLDDILGTLGGPTKKHTTHQDDSRSRPSKKSKQAGESGGRDGEVSALDLLLGTGETRVGKKDAVPAASSSAKKVGSSASDGSVPIKKRKAELQVPAGPSKAGPSSSKVKLPAAASPTTSAALDITSATVRDTPSTAPLGTSAHSITSPRPIDAAIDAVHTLKRLKSALRTLISALSALEAERTLVERFWYKNRAQFRSALWWGAFDGVRRSLRRVLPAAKEDGVGAKGVVRVLVGVYSGLGGGNAQEGEGGWVAIPKFDTRPTPHTIQSYLRAHRDHVRQALEQLARLDALLMVVSARAESAGKVLLTHLNTPPAPTFAPVVTALLALVAGVHAQVQACVGTRDGEGQRGAVDEVERVLHGLLGQD